MHVRVRLFGTPDTVVVVESKLTKIETFRRIIQHKFDIEPKLQRLLYGGKLLEDGCTFHDYNIKLNDVIQLMVKVQPEATTKKEAEMIKTRVISKNEEKKTLYTDTASRLYAVNDLVDIREREQGSWVEGKIVRICYETNAIESHKLKPGNSGNNIDNNKSIQKMKKEDDENMPPVSATDDDSSMAKSKSIAKYFTRIPKGRRKPDKEAIPCEEKIDEEFVLFKVQLDADDEDSNLYCKLKEIRPRARSIIQIKDLKLGQKVMVNYNPEEPLEKGFWFDFTVREIKKLRTNYELVGTFYFGPDAVPQHDTKVRVQDNIYNIEEVVPLNERTIEYNKRMEVIPDKRSTPLNCLACRDDEEASCKDCGCFVCLGKESPDKIVLCDECNYGYHMTCLDPPLSELPEEDWYCPSCKRDSNNVIAPGAAKQTKKTSASKSSRDWGRGMACIGKTKTCAMPANHFGPIPGIEVGMCWRFRIQLSESGVHRPPVSGIHGRDVEGAYSIVLSGGYEDDVDNGNEFTYTGSGGRDLSGNKRTAEQSCDQTLTRENKALARNCAVNCISEEGGDAGDNWRQGKPVRVVRSYKMLKHFPKYAPKEGIRYDGIYKVVKYYPEKGLSGYRVWKYLLRRDDPSPAPWETEGAKHYPIIYPDGYLEAEAERKALKEKSLKNTKARNKRKRALWGSNNTTDSEGEVSPPGKKRKVHSKNDDIQVKKKGRPSKTKGIDKNIKSTSLKKWKTVKTALGAEQKEAIEADKVNIWSEFGCESTEEMYLDDYLEDKPKEKALEDKGLKNTKARNKKRALRESNNTTESESEVSLPRKKRKVHLKNDDIQVNKKGRPSKIKGINKNRTSIDLTKWKAVEAALSVEEKEAIEADTVNSNIWSECMSICESSGKTEFVEHVTQMFLCIICQDVVVNPVTTPCLHNFCMVCIKQAFKLTGSHTCPYCRHNLAKYEPEYNEHLKKALRTILTGYDAGKK